MTYPPFLLAVEARAATVAAREAAAAAAAAGHCGKMPAQHSITNTSRDEFSDGSWRGDQGVLVNLPVSCRDGVSQ